MATICIECDHCICKGCNGAWYNYLCGESQSGLDFITGAAEYGYCRDVNKDGDCPYYENKKAPKRKWYQLRSPKKPKVIFIKEFVTEDELKERSIHGK